MDEERVFEQARRMAAWLNEKNDRDDHQTAQRLLKLSEEVGEVSSAYIGMTGQNPRKGITHTGEDVANELCDVVITALVALQSFTDDMEGFMGAYVTQRRARLEELWPE